MAHRTQESDIAIQMLDSHADVLFSGGIKYFIPRSGLRDQSLFPDELKNKVNSARADELNLLEKAQSEQYQLAFNKVQLNQLKKGKILGLFSPGGMPDGIEHSLIKDDPKRTIPTLKEMSEKAIEILSQNQNGFFLMIEGGQIDWGAHANDAAWVLHDMLKFDEAVAAVVNWAKQRDDTLVIVTADHETGSMGFSYQSNYLPEAMQLDSDEFAHKSFQPLFNYGRYETLDLIYQQKKTFMGIMEEFQKFSKDDQTPLQLMNLVHKYTPYKISETDAKMILENEENESYHEGHKELNRKTWAKIEDFDSFYVYSAERRSAKFSRLFADRQQIVWGTGTHTSTPVMIGAMGPKEWASQFRGVLQGHEIGQIMIEALGLSQR